jgi:multicomponent Na+:H+ antiporter subunit E
MHLFALNLMFALLFALFSGGALGSGLILGFGLGYLALWLTRPLYAPSKYFQRLP